MSYIDECKESGIIEVAFHMSDWVVSHLRRFLKYRVSEKEAIELLRSSLNNCKGGVYEVSSGPYEKISVKDWLKLLDHFGFDGMIKSGFYRIKKVDIDSSIEDQINDFLAIVIMAILEVYNDSLWGIELNEANGNQGGSLREWTLMKKENLMRIFEKLWKREQRKKLM